MEQVSRILEAAAIADASGLTARPGAVLVTDGRVVAAGATDEVVAAAPARCERHPLGDVLLLPAFVNAHSHLDLTAIGPRPFDGSFVSWAEGVMRARPTGDDEVEAAVTAGLRASREGGVGWIGDVAGDERAVRARARARDRVPGTSWLECFGIGARAAEGARRADARLRALREELSEATDWLAVGLQPHAPYSAGDAVYAIAAATDRPSSHLAETREEVEFVAEARGPFADLLSRIGRWDDSIAPRRVTPVRALADRLREASWVLAHCNYLDDGDIAILAGTDCSVAYCPVASEYFGHRDHPYRRLLDAGVRVCLGTDSILCQPENEPHPLGIWPQMRRLFERDATDPSLLLAMATRNGARALGLDACVGTLAAGAPARFATVEFDPRDPDDALTQALRRTATARPVAD